MNPGNKHEYYDVLNLIGYGLAKFDWDFIKGLGFDTKTSFYNYIVSIGIADTTGTVKNRQDLFDPFFDNGRKGWWQKGNAYIHRKIYIDSLFGDLSSKEYAEIVKLSLKECKPVNFINDISISPLLKSKFKQLQFTGKEAELYFLHNYYRIEQFSKGSIEDARLFGDGYDFQITVANSFYLAEVKGVRTNYGGVRMTENEYNKAKEYKNSFALIVVSNLNDIPAMSLYLDPLQTFLVNKSNVSVSQNQYCIPPQFWI